MNFLELPEEMLGEVLKCLDVKSKMCVWYTCKTLRRPLKQSCMLRRVALLDESDIRRHSFLAELGTYVEELDLSGFESLTDEPATSVVRLFPNLRSLDVTRTKISALCLSDLCDLCPRLKRLAACFDFDNGTELSVVSGSYRSFVEKCQRAFRSLEDIHFVCRFCNDCDHPMQVINACDSLRHLRLDLVQGSFLSFCNHHFESPTRVPPTLLTFVVKISEGCVFTPANGHMKYLDILNWQGVLVNEDEHLEPHFSMTEKLLKKHESTAHYEQLEWNRPEDLLFEISHLYMWHSDLERRRPDLYDEIVSRVYAQTPHVVCCCERRRADRSRTRFLVKACVLQVDLSDRAKLFNLDEWIDPPVGGQPLRMSLTNSPCRCSDDFEIEDVLLQLDFRSTALLNLSYLSIIDCMLDPSAAIVLFENCKNLKTLLLIWISSDVSFYSEIVKNLHLSVSIQNVMCVGYKMNIKKSVCALARCPTLRHVHLVSSEQNRKCKTTLPTVQTYCDLLVGCPDLRSFTLYPWLALISRNQKAVFKKSLRQLQRNVPFFISDSLENVNFNRYCGEFNISDTSNLFRDIDVNYDLI